MAAKSGRRSGGPKPIALALQGGVHGVFDWGVLDRLLEDDQLEIEGVSATSAGAMKPQCWPMDCKRAMPKTRTRRCTTSGLLASCRAIVGKVQPVPSDALVERAPQLRSRPLALVPDSGQYPSYPVTVTIQSGFLSVVASSSALVRHNRPPAAWSSGIGVFTTVFALR